MRTLARLLRALADRIDSERPAPADPQRVLPRSRIVRASFSFHLEAAATEAEIEEWLELQLGSGGMDADNPLAEHGLDTIGAIVLNDTGLHQHLRVHRSEGGYVVHREPRPEPYAGPGLLDIVGDPRHPAILDGPAPRLDG